jgi:hypothetical protein
MFQKNKKVNVEEKKSSEDWMTRRWRPMMAIMYMICCIMDFAVFPIMFTVVQFWETAIQNDAFRQWAPITLQGGGLFHVALGAVLGVSAFGRTQEKVAGVSGGAASATTPAMPAPSASTPAPVAMTPTAVYTPAPSAPEQTFTSSAVESPQVFAGFGGKPSPAPAAQPLL